MVALRWSSPALALCRDFLACFLERFGVCILLSSRPDGRGSYIHVLGLVGNDGSKGSKVVLKIGQCNVLRMQMLH